jgi:hypothetical protein
MSFVAAGFLFALFALAIPWWLHRRQAQASDPVLVGSLLLLQSSPAPESRRKTLRYRVLLALRLLLLALLVLAFAQPVLNAVLSAPAINSAPPRLVVVDVSASMQPYLAQARELAGELMQGRSALATAGAQLTVLEPLTADPQRHAAALGALTTSAASLSYENLPARLSTLADSLAASGERVSIYFVSDFQLSAAPARFNTLVDGITHPLFLNPVARTALPNWQVQFDGANEIAVRGTNTPSADVAVEVSREGEVLMADRLSVAPSGQVVLTLPTIATSRHDQRLTVTIVPPAIDALAADNVRYLVNSQQQYQPVAVIGSSAQQRYVRTALQAGDSRQATTALTAQVAVALDPAEAVGELGEYLRSGGRALLFAGADVRNSLAELVPDILVVDSLDSQRTRRVATTDNGHPALARVGAWEDVAVFAHLQLKADSAQVLARLDNGDPWLLEASVGLGRVLLVSASLAPRWTNLAASAGFLLFLEDALSYLSEDFTPTDIAAGSTLRLPFGNAQILNGAGERMLNLGQSQGAAVISLQQPGHYELRTAGMVTESESSRSTSGRRYLAVNVPQGESDLSLMSDSALQRWREASLSDADASVGSTEDRSDRPDASFYDLPLAPWLLGLALLMLLAETALANGSVPTPARSQALSS